jgi:iron complex outermembrane recepter protein
MPGVRLIGFKQQTSWGFDMSRCMHQVTSVGSWILAFAIAAPGTVWADTGTDGSVDTSHNDPRIADSETGDQSRISEIVVTARKRTESMQDIPLSVSVLTGATLEQAGMTDFQQYAVHIPNLSFGYLDYFAPTAQSIAIRGVQGPNTTGMYVDDTPLPENLDPRAIDLDRIEVLRGPQGTLYGADSMGGTVRLVTRQPDTAAFAASAHDALSYTQGGGVNDAVDGMLNLPLAQSAAVRLVGFYDTVSGVLNKLPLPDSPIKFPEQKGVDASDHKGGSISGLVNMADDSVTITPKFIFGRMHADGLPYADTYPGNFTQYRLYDIHEPINDDWNLGTVTLRWRNRFGELTSASSYFSRSGSDLQDFSEAADLILGTSGPIPAVQLDVLHQTATIEELRFTSSFTGPFQITSGAFYEDTKKRLTTPPIVFGSTPNLFAQDLRDETNEYALFAEATYNLTSHLQLLAGARAYKTTDDYSNTMSGTLAYDGTLGGIQSARGVSPKYSLEYSITDQIKAYATAAKGFRLGGVNAFPVNLCAQDLADLHISQQSAGAYNSDSLWSYELGLKSEFADRRIRLNVAAYQIDWKNLQQTLGFPLCGYTITVNSGKARSNGGEVELDAVVVNGLNISFGTGYEDAVITESTTAIRPDTPVQQIPRWNVTSSADYQFTLAGQNLFARADFAYVGSSISTNNFVNPPYERGAYSQSNARIGKHFDKLRLDVSVFCDNVLNRIGNLGDPQPLAIADPNRPQIAITRPRTTGLDLRVQF